MDNNNVFKYIFAAVVVFLIGYTAYILLNNHSDDNNTSLDQTSTVNTIQTDLRLAIAELDTMNPILSHNRNVQEITKIIFEPLVTLNENCKLQYCLAKEIAKTDDYNYVIKLREGILWQDGTKFTADDVIFTIETILNHEISTIYSENLKYVTEIEEIDSTTIRIGLAQPVPFFEYYLTFPIVCQSYYEGENFATSEKTPIGTGMFRIAEMSSNIIKLERNEQYWDTSKNPMATQVIINLYNSIGEVYNAFKSGDIDIVTVKNANIEEYIGTLGYNKIEYKYRDYDFLAFNTENPIFIDSAVRKALSLAIDKNALVVNCLGKGYVASNFSLDIGNWLYTKDLNVAVDKEQATQILLDNGWTRTNNIWQKRINGRNLKLAFTLTVNGNNESRMAVAESIKTELENFGVQVNVKQLSYENYLATLNNREYDCILTGIETGFSPDLSTFFGEGNIANYYNEEVLEILRVVTHSTDEDTLYQSYNRLYDIYLEEAPYIGLYRNTAMVIYNQGLVGNITPNIFNVYHNIEKWYRQ